MVVCVSTEFFRSLLGEERERETDGYGIMGPWSPSARGGRANEAIVRYGFHRSTIYGWCKAERGRGNGLRAPASCPPGDGTSAYRGKRGRCFGGATARTPGSMDSIGLWTRHIVREVGEAAFLSALESSLDRLGACPTKSDIAEATAACLPNAIPTRWHPGSATYPAISRQAKWDEGEIYFLDESGVGANAVYGTTWGPRDAGLIGARPASEHQRHVGRRAVRAKGSELGSRRTCALLLRVQMTVDGSLRKTRENFRLNPEHLPERALHSAAWH